MLGEPRGRCRPDLSSTTSRWAACAPCRSIVEQYRLLTSADSPLGERDQVTWAEVARIAALPFDAGHAEPTHHRPACSHAAGVQARAHARIQLHDRAVLACPHRPLGQSIMPREAGAIRSALTEPLRARSRSSSPRPVHHDRPGRHRRVNRMTPLVSGARCRSDAFGVEDDLGRLLLVLSGLSALHIVSNQ